MNKLLGESVALARDIAARLEECSAVEVVVCPVNTAVAAVADVLSGTAFEVGGQNCYIKESGAYTGEVSPQMLRDAGCAWCIVGHSERRQYFGEDDAFLNQKLRFARSAGLKVMFCIGETLEERENGRMDEVLRRQVSVGLADLTAADLQGLVIAYEPVWAIGTGLTATPDQAQEAHAFVRGLVRAAYGETVADAVRIQYGGSVKPDNAQELMQQPDVDGALVGGASLDAAGFAAIVEAAAAVEAA
jgi:triosephosphate isomerase (TIM)